MEIKIGQFLAAGAVAEACRPCAEVVVERTGRAGGRTDAAARISNDELLLSRQARELAALSGTIRSLEGALASANSAAIDAESALRTPDVSATGDVGIVEPGSHRPPRVIGESSEGRIDIQKVLVLPTVYTNLGSLLDVFA